MVTPLPLLPPTKRTNSVKILVLVGAVLLAALGSCVTGLFWLKAKAGGGTVVELVERVMPITFFAPSAVKAALAGPRKDYVGWWTAGEDVQLFIASDGNLKWERRQDDPTGRVPSYTVETIEAPIAAFAGDDIVVKLVFKKVLRVSRPPHEVGEHWEMTVEGVSLKRP
jgi:hypothetical protein